MASTILSDNGVSSGSAGIKTTADGTGVLALQTTTAGGAATTAVTIDTSQNVGIGTATLTSGVRLYVSNATSGAPATTGTTQTSGALRIRSGSNAICDFGIGAGSGTTTWIQAADQTGLNTNYDLALQPNGGNVGIGTASPSTKFHVVGEITATQGVGGTPTLSYYASSATTLTQGVFTKIGLQTSVFDTTGGMFASSRFTPTVAGYYQINAAICFNTSATAQQDAIAIYKNGSNYQIGTYIPDTGNLGLRAVMSTIVYCNGSTDYIELYGLYNAGPATQAINAASSQNTWFNACLIRGA